MFKIFNNISLDKSNDLILLILLLWKSNSKCFNKIRKEKDNPNYLNYLIWLRSSYKSNWFNKITLDKTNSLISLI